jgi:hypothetical protein
MESLDSVKTLIKMSGDYLDTKIELTKLKTIDKSSEILSNLVYLLVKVLIIVLLLGFISIGLAVLIGTTLGEYYYGFLIIGGIYAIIFLIIHIQRKKWIKEPVANGLINKMLK